MSMFPVLSRCMLPLVLCLLAAAGSIFKAASRDAFSLWDVGYYLAILGALLCIERLVQGRSQSPAAAGARA